MYRQYMKPLLGPFCFVAGAGVLLHFTYENLGHGFLVSVVSATNESTWEHLKLLFFPMVFYTLYQILREKGSLAVVPGNLVATLAGMGFIVAAFYTCLGVIGHSIDALNIVIYLIAVALTLWLALRLRGIHTRFHPALACAVTAVLVLLFIVFTYAPPSIGLFYDPGRLPT